MKKTIGIFQGKQAKYNKYLLETLYDDGPLTAWKMTEGYRGNRHSLHATYNKRLRNLQKKGYVCKMGKYWYFRFKGILAVLLIQPKPRLWNMKWTDFINDYVKSLGGEGLTKVSFKIQRKTIRLEGRPREALSKFEGWVALAIDVKKLMDKGVINFDVIKNETLFSILTTEIFSRDRPSESDRVTDRE